MKPETKWHVPYCGWLILCLALVLWISLYPDTSSAVGKERIVRVGVYENAPKVFLSESGSPAGIFVDIIERIAESEGWTLGGVPGTWGEGLNRLSKREIDLMPDVAYSLEREKLFAFHKEPVLSDWFQVYTKKDKRIRSIVDMDGTKVVVLERSVQQETFRHLSESFGLQMTLIALPDYKKAFEMVARGDADAAITNRFYGLIHAHKMGLEDTAIIFHPTSLFFAAPRGAGEDLLKSIDSQLLILKKDPQSVYYRSLKRWTAEKIAFQLPAWVKPASLIAGLVLVISLIAGVLLKFQVNARTRELRQINKEMEERIKLRTAELANAMEKAQTADKIKTAFLATMSHELRTPLNSIIGFTGIILQGIVGPLNDEQKKQLGLVRDSAKHLLSLINDVLDISKIEAGQLKVAREPYDLRRTLEKAIASARPLADKKGLTLSLDLSPGLEAMTGDSRRVEQIILNLISNAIKFTEKGSVTIVSETDDHNVTIMVTDTGIGIKPEDMDTIFKPFQQIDSGMTRKYEGTGLGLPICRRLIDLMGGGIRATSVWGSGSTFYISLPRERKET
jgi:signal transduction histidine kinase